ncbi:RNA-directed DNA polymerase from mobile element jockey [Trichonephila clavipes]|nr:RNA-directed DNA polymerase from mobile element jockey [Trichonephila clavipes]
MVKLADSWLSCNEFKPSTAEDPPCKGTMHVKSIRSSNVLPLVCCGSSERSMTGQSPSNEHLDVALGRLGENISEALVAASKPKFKTTPIKLPPDIRSKIRHRNRVRRFWQRSRDPALKNELRTISNEIASDIRNLSRARWEKTIEELSPETGTLWRRTSLLKKPLHHISPHLKGALGSIAVAPIGKAEVIADSLQKQFEPNTDEENPRFSVHIQRKVQRFLDSPTCMDLEKTSPSEIQEFIKNLKPNKYPCIDLITNRIHKNLPTKFITFITLLFNILLENCYFPKVGGLPW